MKALLQRVSSSKVSVEGRVVGGIGRGITVLLGVVPEDDQRDIDRGSPMKCTLSLSKL